ncbi:hypothetical protein [Spirosoma daeguense]
MKKIILYLFLFMPLSLLAQTPESVGVIHTESDSLKTSDNSEEEKIAPTLSDKPAVTSQARARDTIAIKRRLLTTGLYFKGKRLSMAGALYTFQKAPKSMPKSLNLYQWGSGLKPFGPLMVLTGVYVGYIAVKGKTATANVRGLGGTLSNPVVPDVPVNYTVRNLPHLLAGVGLVIGGISLIELSNELIAKAARNYNSKVWRPRKVALIYNTKFGITPDGNVGLLARF